jgi:hypothetical protein
MAGKESKNSANEDRIKKSFELESMKATVICKIGFSC